MSIKISSPDTFDGAEIAVTFPVSSTRKTAKTITIIINDDGTINIPATGDLEPTFEIPELLNAISYARDISTRIFEVEGIGFRGSDIL